MNEHEEVTLETDHLEEVIETTTPGQPVVVIEYRTRGLPWHIALLTIALVAFVAAVVSYNVVASRARPYPFSGPPGGAMAPTPSSATAGQSDPPAAPTLRSSDMLVADLSAGPLSLNTQPVGPSPPPAPKVTQEAAKTVAPAPEPTKAQPPSLASNPPTPAAPPKAATPSVAPAAGGSDVSGTATPSVAPAAGGSDVSGTATPPAPGPAARPVPRNPISVGFSNPADGQSPFDALPVSPRSPSLPLADERQNPSPEPAVADAAGPDQKPTPSKQELEAQLRAEAAEKKAEINQLRDLKDQARSQADAESRARVDEERATFRDLLSQILQSRSSKAGKQIDELCNQYGRAYDSEMKSRVYYGLRHMPGRTTRELKVRFMREMGVPEPAILDFLANEIHRTINSRNGPRDSNEVRVNAAKLLLSFKLPKSSGGSPKAINPLVTGPAR